MTVQDDSKLGARPLHYACTVHIGPLQAEDINLLPSSGHQHSRVITGHVVEDVED